MIITFPRAFVNSMATTPETVAQAREARRDTPTVTQDVLLRRSADSAAMVDYWDTTDTIVDGIAAMRLAGARFLPRFTDEDDSDYRYRLNCTKLTNVYRDTVEGLASKPFEQEVALAQDGEAAIPQAMLDFTENVDGSGNNLTVFAGATFFNGINSAIHWIFVDHPPRDEAVRTVADAKVRGLRPYWSHVLGRNVLDPRSTVVNGTERLTYIRVFEPGGPDRIRIFERMPNGQVRWELREKGNAWIDYVDPDRGLNGKTQFALVDGAEGAGVLSIDVIPLVPFVTARRDGRSWKLFPMMRDAADLQIELYQQESALKWNKTLGAYSMLSGQGIKPQMGADGKTPLKVRVGPNRVLYAPIDGNGNSGRWEYVQPSAEIMKFLAEDVKDTISQLRELGRQPLTAQSGNLTVITTAVAAGKAKSAVKAWAYGLKDALENAFVITAKYLAVDKATYDPVVSVYVEFDEFIDGKDLEALKAARDTKDLSRQTYWDELKRRAVLSPEFDPDVEEQRLLDELPGDGEDTSITDNPPAGETR